MKCENCGKEIKSNIDAVTVEISISDEEYSLETWCYDCYRGARRRPNVRLFE